MEEREVITPEVVDATDVESPHATRDAFFKLVIGTAGQFLAGRLIENGYDTIVTRIRSKKA